MVSGSQRRLRLRPTLVAVMATLLLATVAGIAAITWHGTVDAVDLLVDQQLEASRHTALAQIEQLPRIATAQIQQTTSLMRQGRLDPSDIDATGAYLVEHVRAEPLIAWFSYGDARNGTYIGGNRAFADSSIRLQVVQTDRNNSRPVGWKIDPTGKRTPVDLSHLGPYNVRGKKWFTDTMAVPGLVWSAPYRYTEGPMGVTASQRVHIPGAATPVGMVHVDFFLRDLGRWLRESRVGVTGRVAVRARDGQWIGLAPDEKALRGVFDALTKLAQDPTGKPVRFSHKSRQWRGSLTAVGGTAMSWQVALVAPEEELTGLVDNNLRRTAFIGLLAFLLALAAAAWLAHRMAQVITPISAELDKMAAMELDGAALPESMIRELDTLSKATERTRAGLRSFGRYVPRQLVRRLLAAGREARAEVRPVELTLMFSDLAGFTSLSERLEPDRLVALLDGYLDAMSRIVLAHDGTIDKYIGDAIMAFWNAPEPVQDHPAAACRAALKSQQVLAELRQRWQDEGLPPLYARIGLHVGPALVGNLGTEERLNYTAIGDTVNLAARMESLGSHYGTEILISEALRDRVGAAFVCRPVDVVAVKGKKQGVAIFELIATAEEATEADRAWAIACRTAMHHYTKRRFEQAAAAWDEAINQRPNDEASKVLRDRALAFAKEPPPEDWTGVHVMTSK